MVTAIQAFVRPPHAFFKHLILLFAFLFRYGQLKVAKLLMQEYGCSPTCTDNVCTYQAALVHVTMVLESFQNASDQV